MCRWRPGGAVLVPSLPYPFHRVGGLPRVALQAPTLCVQSRDLWRIAIVGLLVTSFLAVPGNAQTPGPDVQLTLEPDFDLNNATLLVGKITVTGVSIRNPGFVATRAMTHSATNVTVCPVESGGSGVVRPLLVAQFDCDGGITHEAPEIAFGQRTTIQFAGAYPPGATQSGSMSIVIPNGPFGGATIASVLGNGTVDFSFDSDVMRFQPTIGSSQVRVTSAGERFFYNGTAWQFLFGGAGSVQVVANGYHASVGTSFDFQLEPMLPSEVNDATRPHVMLALQEAIIGPDAREAIGNLTDQLRLSRSPVFFNGAVVGLLNGTVHGHRLSGEPVAHARFDSLVGRVTGDQLTATGKLNMLVVEDGIWFDDEPGDVPWTLGITIWILALAAFFLGRSAPPRTWVNRVSDLIAPLIIFLVTNWVLAAQVGTGALALAWSGDYGPGASLRLVVFAIIAALGVLALIYLPVRLAVRHVVPERLAWTAAPGALMLAALYAWLAAADVLAVAFRFARL